MARAHSSKRPRMAPQHYLSAPPRKMWPWRLGAAIVGVVLFLGTGAGLAFHDLQGSVNISNADALLERKPVDSYEGRALNILVLGTDTRKGEGNAIDQTDDETDRSDTTMIAHISRDRKHVNVVSLARDTMVDIPSCPLGNGKHTQAQWGQFNWAFAYGGSAGNRDAAIACTIMTVEKMTGLHIDDYVLVDFNGFRSMVDALGGIRVYVDSPINDWHVDLDIDAGCYTMDGQMALKYARVRYGVKGGDGSDTQRMKRQQHVVSVMVREALSKNLLTSVPELYKFARAGLSSLTTSSSLSNLSTLTGLAYSLQGIDPHKMLFLSAPIGQDPADLNRVVLDERAPALWQALKNDRDLPAGLDVKDLAGNEFTTSGPDSTAEAKETTRAPESASHDSQAPSHSTPTPSATAPSVDPVEKARLECEPKG